MEKEKAMLSNNPTEASLPRDSKPSDSEVPLLKPQDPIEVGNGGNGTTTDPAGSDVRPPGYGDFELLT